MDNRYTVKLSAKLGAKLKALAVKERRGVASVTERLIEAGLKAEKIK